MHIYNLLYYFQLLCFALSFIYSLKTIGNRNVPSYMKWFFIYSIVAFAGVSIVSVIRYLKSNSDDTAMTVTIFSIYFHYFFLAIFFRGILKKKTSKRILTIILIPSIPIVLIIVYLNLSEPFGLESFSVANFFLIVYCAIYFWELFTSFPKYELLQEPSFWIVSGIFLSLGAIIPIHFTYQYLKTNLNFEVFDKLKAVCCFAYGTMHLFFIKAYLCSTAQKKVS